MIRKIFAFVLATVFFYFLVGEYNFLWMLSKTPLQLLLLPMIYFYAVIFWFLLCLLTDPACLEHSDEGKDK